MIVGLVNKVYMKVVKLKIVWKGLKDSGVVYEKEGALWLELGGKTKMRFWCVPMV